MAYYPDSFSTEASNVLPSGKAATALSVGDLVYLTSSGTWAKAVSVAVGQTRTDAVGVMVQNALIYEMVSPVKKAVISGYSALTVGASEYLSASAGVRTESELTATVRQYVGFNKSATEIKFDVQSASGTYTTTGAMAVTSVASAGAIVVATSGEPMAITASTYGFACYTTTSITTGEATGAYVVHTFTGAGGTGWGFKCVTNVTNVALGAYANSGYFYMDLKTSGSVSGLGSALCAELVLPGSAMAASGTYACLELEMGCSTSWSGTNAVAFINCTVYGATAGNFDDYGFLFDISGVTIATTHLVQVNTAGAATHAIRCRINGTAYYLMATTTGA